MHQCELHGFYWLLASDHSATRNKQGRQLPHTELSNCKERIIQGHTCIPIIDQSHNSHSADPIFSATSINPSRFAHDTVVRFTISIKHFQTPLVSIIFSQMISSAFRSTLRSRALVAPRFAAPKMVRMSFPQIRMYSAHEETFEEFTARYVK